MRTAPFFLGLALTGPLAFGQEIVVTAERRAVAAELLPSNAAALDAEDLARIGAQAPSEALNRLPAVAIQRGSGVESLPAIRSPVLTGGQGAGSVLVLEDGTPIRAPGFANINQAFELGLDLAARVEVTRGPGSALSGSNAVHGTIDVASLLNGGASNAPRSQANAEAGQFGRSAVRAVRIVDPGEGGRAFALGLALRREEGWRAEAGVDQALARAAIAGRAGSWAYSAHLVGQTIAQETAGFVEGADAYRSLSASRANANPEAFRDTRVLRTQARLERPIGADWTLSFTPYARAIETDLLLHFFPSRALEQTEQTGAGLQTTAYYDPSKDVSVILGADIERTRGALYEFQARPSVGTFPQGLHYDYAVTMDVGAFYAQARWAFAQDWRLVVGARGEASRYDYDNRAPSNDVGRFRRPADRVDTFRTLTPKLGLVRSLGPGAAWLNLARGARAPQITDLYSLQTQQVPGAQKAEIIDSAEIGWRTRGAWGRLELAAYAMEKKDGAFRNAAGFTVTNAETRHRGVEVSGDWNAADWATLSGWASLARHSYAFSDPAAAAGESIRKGDAIDTAPERLANLQLEVRPRADVSLELGWSHVSRYATNAANTRFYPGHDVLDLRGAWRLGPGLALDVAIRNLADVRYAERADFAFGQDRYFPGESRALTLGLRFAR
jgi:outer membrane receptor protein involved in Fe transport